MRKCFILSETVFGKERGLIKELSNYVVENLGDVYPELERNIRQVSSDSSKIKYFVYPKRP